MKTFLSILMLALLVTAAAGCQKNNDHNMSAAEHAQM